MYEYNCRIVKVIDGDTVDVDIDLGFDVILSKQRVRLYGIDTPESRTRDLEEKKYGLMAKDYVKSYLKNGSTQVLKTKLDKARGKFGRILGEFIVYDAYEDRHHSLNEMMIRDCHAVAYHGQSKEEIQQQHLENRDKVWIRSTLLKEMEVVKGLTLKNSTES